MTKRMGRVICDITISADGYSAGLNQTEERPFGDDGSDGSGGKLHAWMFDTPEENRAEVDQMTAAQAFIMGRNMFGPVRGEWDRQWNGWWGDDPPFHAPVFVLTHHARDPQPMDGGTTYYFVTGGIESALAQARAAAGDGDVAIQGGATTINQYHRRRSDRRAAAAHCAAHARRRHAAVRGRPAAETRAGEVASRDPRLRT